MIDTKALVAISASSGVVVGAATAYFITKSVVKKQFNETLEREVSEIRTMYKRLHKADEYATVDGAADAILDNIVRPEDIQTSEDIVFAQGYGEISDEDLEDAGHPRRDSTTTNYQRLSEEAQLNQGKAADEDEDEQENLEVVIKVTSAQPGAVEVTQIEDKPRDPTVPYVISKDEFFDDSADYVKLNLTYYDGDDTLVDEKDSPIDTVDALVGTDSLHKFGHLSGDKNIVYVRNERFEQDYEIVFDPRDYTDVVLGIKNIWDENEKRTLKMRGRDE